jgi:hypothetical protein
MLYAHLDGKQRKFNSRSNRDSRRQLRSVPFLSAEPVSALDSAGRPRSFHKQPKIENLAFPSALFFFLLLE